MEFKIANVGTKEVGQVLFIEFVDVIKTAELVHFAPIEVKWLLCELDKGSDLHAYHTHLDDSVSGIMRYNSPIQHVQPAKAELKTLFFCREVFKLRHVSENGVRHDVGIFVAIQSVQ